MINSISSNDNNSGLKTEFSKQGHDIKICEIFKKIELPSLQLLQKKELTPEKCLIQIFQLNGDYYQAKNSPLKKSWDDAVKQISVNLNGKNIEKRVDFIKLYSELLELGAQDIKVLSTIKAMANYLKLEDDRNFTQEQLNTLVRYIKKTSTVCIQFQQNLENEKKGIENRNKILCGNNFNGLIDQAWKTFSGEYQKLNEEKKANDSKLHFIDQLIKLEPLDEKTYQKYQEQLSEEFGKEQLKKIEKFISECTTFQETANIKNSVSFPSPEGKKSLISFLNLENPSKAVVVNIPKKEKDSNEEQVNDLLIEEEVDDPIIEQSKESKSNEAFEKNRSSTSATKEWFGIAALVAVIAIPVGLMVFQRIKKK